MCKDQRQNFDKSSGDGNIIFQYMADFIIANPRLVTINTSPVGQLKQLHSFRSCPVTYAALRSRYGNIRFSNFRMVSKSQK